MNAKTDYELNKEVQYWAGRLIGHEQNYQIAQEIVDAINNAEEVVRNLTIPDVVGQSEQLPLEFIKWYSGMEEQKILNAHKRWKKEKG